MKKTIFSKNAKFLVLNILKSNLDVFTLVKCMKDDIIYIYSRSIWEKEEFIAKSLYKRVEVDYIKNDKGEENLLHYKVKNVMNSDELKAITDTGVSGDTSVSGNASGTSGVSGVSETFNKIYKVADTIDETVGVSSNNDDWRIHEYKNHKLDKEYAQEYDTIKFDIKSDLLENYKKQGYIENIPTHN
jgi:hypothetical protein